MGSLFHSPRKKAGLGRCEEERNKSDPKGDQGQQAKLKTMPSISSVDILSASFLPANFSSIKPIHTGLPPNQNHNHRIAAQASTARVSLLTLNTVVTTVHPLISLPVLFAATLQPFVQYPMMSPRLYRPGNWEMRSSLHLKLHQSPAAGQRRRRAQPLRLHHPLRPPLHQHQSAT